MTMNIFVAESSTFLRKDGYISHKDAPHANLAIGEYIYTQCINNYFMIQVIHSAY